MTVTSVRDARSRVDTLERQLTRAVAELDALEKRRSKYDAAVQPAIADAREVVGECVASLQEWRQRFGDAVDEFATDSLGELGRDLVQIERRLYAALHRVVSTAHNAKMQELGMTPTVDNGLERVQHVEPAARAALVHAGGDDPRLTVWSDVTSETGQRFREMILSYCTDQRVRIYDPNRGLAQFR